MSHTLTHYSTGEETMQTDLNTDCLDTVVMPALKEFPAPEWEWEEEEATMRRLAAEFALPLRDLIIDTGPFVKVRALTPRGLDWLQNNIPDDADWLRGSVVLARVDAFKFAHQAIGAGLLVD
jgi:hypothetical protein